jgi:hypothetical protein
LDGERYTVQGDHAAAAEVPIRLAQVFDFDHGRDQGLGIRD